MELDVEKILELAKAKGASEAEACIHTITSTEVAARKSSIENAVIEKFVRVGVRVAVGKRIGAAGGIVSGYKDVERVVERAISIARTAREDKDWPGFNPKVGRASTVPETYDESIESLSPEDLVKLLGSQIKTVTMKEGVSLAEAAVSGEVLRSQYGNTNGGVIDGLTTTFAYVVELKSKTAGGEGTFYDYFAKAKYMPEKVEETTRNAVEKVLLAAEAKPIETFKGDMILLQDEASSIIGVLLSPAVSAEQAQQGRSPLKGRLEEKVLNERITVIDDPFLPWETGSASWDSEGHPTMRKNVFENGVFKTFLYDHYTASKEGRESTGNAYRRTPWAKPTPAPMNLVVTVEGASRSLEDLLGDVEKGVVVVRTIGSWMSNPISGQINATVSFGLLVENGSITRPVKGAVIADNIYEVLGERFAGAAEPQECRSGVCAPIIRARGVTFSGKG